VLKKYPQDMGCGGLHLSTYEDIMFRKLLALMTVLTAAVFFTQTVVATEAPSFTTVAGKTQKKKGAQKTQQKKTQAKKNIQKKNTGKKGKK
jgi:hypothetical protein